MKSTGTILYVFLTIFFLGAAFIYLLIGGMSGDKNWSVMPFSMLLILGLICIARLVFLIKDSKSK